MIWKTNFQVFGDYRQCSLELAIIPVGCTPFINNFGWGDNRKIILFSNGGNRWPGIENYDSQEKHEAAVESAKAFVQSICDAMNAAQIPVPNK